MEVAVLLAQVVQMAPNVINLVNTLAQIKSQTEKDHPEVWAKIRKDFVNTKAQLDALMK
jgi:hypothetical protein